MKAPAKKKPIPCEFKGGRHLRAIEDNPNLRDPGEYLIMQFLASRCDLGENATFEDEKDYTKNYIAEKCRMSPATVKRKSIQLAEKGYIILTPNIDETGSFRANTYRITRKIFDEYLVRQIEPGVSVTLGWGQRDPTIHNYEHNMIKEAATTESLPKGVREKREPERQP